jgi:RNA polymerase sigma-70 factor (ECF subfamily)
LLQRLREPDPQAAWERFVQIYTPLLCHWARRLGAIGPEVDDLTQDVFMVLLQKLPAFEYDPDQRFRGWLWTVVRNKHRERRRRTAAANSPLVGIALEPAASDPLEAVIEADYQQYVVQHALRLMQNEFEPATWQAFWECTVHERAPAAVAAELQLSLAAVYTAKSRVLRRLRAEMQGLLG